MSAFNSLAIFGQGISVALLALGVGFIVCDIASRQKDFLKYLGYIVGAAIMLLSLILVFNSLVSGVSLSRRLTTLMPQQRLMQPYTTPSMPSLQNQTQTK
ncbi:MAG: hypothetical protein NC914_03135 [Candidatus Omnitrophica bacterium]|nr:hypothetical protein [Candidatus Omnitrophota bacterium]